VRVPAIASVAIFLLAMALPVAILAGVLRVDATRDPVTGAPRRVGPPRVTFALAALALAAGTVGFVFGDREFVGPAIALTLLVLVVDFASGRSPWLRIGRR